MNKGILIFTALCSSIFASNVSENLTYKDLPKEVKPNVGHFILSLGGYSSQYDYAEVIPVISFGYQSKIMDNSVFQSALIEWTNSTPYSEYIVEKNYTEKVSKLQLTGLHYFQVDEYVRYFMGAGAHSGGSEFTSHKEKDPEADYQPKTLVNSFIGLSFTAGIETGNPNGIISILKLGYDHPVIELGSNNNLSTQGKLFLIFGVGF